MSARRSRSHRSLRPICMIFVLLFVNIAETAAEDDAFNAEVCRLTRFECCTKIHETNCVAFVFFTCGVVKFCLAAFCSGRSGLE